MKLEVRQGNMLNPKETGQKIICHVVNDQGIWPNTETAKDIAAKHPTVLKRYTEKFVGDRGLEMGQVYFTVISMDKLVANMVAQHGVTRSGGIYIDEQALEDCLEVVKAKATFLGNAAVAMSPGSITGEDFAKVVPIVEKVFTNYPSPVTAYVYYPADVAKLTEQCEEALTPPEPEPEPEPEEDEELEQLRQEFAEAEKKAAELKAALAEKEPPQEEVTVEEEVTEPVEGAPKEEPKPKEKPAEKPEEKTEKKPVEKPVKPPKEKEDAGIEKEGQTHREEGAEEEKGRDVQQEGDGDGEAEPEPSAGPEPTETQEAEKPVAKPEEKTEEPKVEEKNQDS